ncbi:MAG: DUF1847 domain-containing protein [Candidatus Odinarchaeia archaeon]
MDCTSCKTKKCRGANPEDLFKECTTIKFKHTLDKTIDKYSTKGVKDLYHTAAEVESEGYMKWPRLKELIEFANKLDFKKIGIAFCIGLNEEAREITTILREYGFEVLPVVCKVGAIPKSKLGIPGLRDSPSKEAACNPIGQAEILNKYGTDLNIIIGLCLGHDMIFTKFSEAPVTTLIVKDRVLCHNPAAVIYSSYYKNYFHKTDY